MIIFAVGRGAGYRLWTSVLMMCVGLFCMWLPAVQAKVGVQPIVLPQSVTRSVIVDKSEWQGVGIELEHLRSHTTLETTLEQLAMLLPPLTPIWSEQGVARAHWIAAESSYVLFLWANEMHGTEGLLSSLALGQSSRFIQKNVPMHSASFAWLPIQAVKLFSFVDKSNGPPRSLTSYTVPIVPSLLIQQLKAYARRNGWLFLSDELTFLRDVKRLSFLIHPDKGNTTVLVHETSIESP